MPHPNSGNLVVHPLEPGIAAANWFEKFRHLPHPVLLASGNSGHGAARFDILTADPRCLLRTDAGRTVVTQADGTAPQTFDEDPFAVLARFCVVGDTPSAPDLPFTGGAIGYFGYELLHGANGIDHTDKPELGAADMLVGIYDWAIIIDTGSGGGPLPARGAVRIEFHEGRIPRVFPAHHRLHPRRRLLPGEPHAMLHGALQR
jgi:anthranilate/para-aminobenzoate synthase component I